MKFHILFDMELFFWRRESEIISVRRSKIIVSAVKYSYIKPLIFCAKIFHRGKVRNFAWGQFQMDESDRDIQELEVIPIENEVKMQDDLEVKKNDASDSEDEDNVSSDMFQ